MLWQKSPVKPPQTINYIASQLNLPQSHLAQNGKDQGGSRQTAQLSGIIKATKVSTSTPSKKHSANKTITIQDHQQYFHRVGNLNHTLTHLHTPQSALDSLMTAHRANLTTSNFY